MAQISIRKLDGSDGGVLEVSDEVFAAAVNEPLMHQAVVQLLANRRAGTHNTKTRGQVSGGGAKPWRQKGTGRARQGSRVSPLWRGGGTVFGPHPRGYRQEMPKKMRRGALRSGLSSRFANGDIRAIDAFVADEPKTKLMAAAFARLGLEGSIVLVLENDRPQENADLAVRNLERVETRYADSLNLLDVLGADRLLFTVPALQAIERRLSDGSR
ncbi:MAG TPA: 50S ribosomal protein L4 [Chloroflexota bacterium]|nr:50S ribosomal protein L4 [Chloroflexota bacterium]